METLIHDYKDISLICEYDPERKVHVVTYGTILLSDVEYIPSSLESETGFEYPAQWYIETLDYRVESLRMAMRKLLPLAMLYAKHADEVLSIHDYNQGKGEILIDNGVDRTRFARYDPSENGYYIYRNTKRLRTVHFVPIAFYPTVDRFEGGYWVDEHGFRYATILEALAELSTLPVR